MVFETVSKHKVFLKEFINYGQKRAINSILLENAPITSDISGQEQKMSQVLNPANMYKMQDKACEIVIEKIIKSDGKEITSNFATEILEWDSEDAEPLVEKVMSIVSLKKGA